MSEKQHRLAVFLLWATPALWSTNYLIARTAAGVVAPHQLALGRWVIALALMLPFCAATLASAPRTWLKEWPQLLVLGGLGMWICGAFVYLGGQSSPALNIGLIYAACPVGIALLSVRLLHERVSRAQALGGALALAGVVHVVVRGQWAQLAHFKLTVGDAWIVAAAISWVGYAVLNVHWRSALPAQARLAAVTAGGVLVLLPFTALEAALAPTPDWGAQAWGLVLGAALGPGFFAYSAHAHVQRVLGAARTSLMLYLAPMWAAALAWLLLGETPRPDHAVGAALILPSIWLASRQGSVKK